MSVYYNIRDKLDDIGRDANDNAELIGDYYRLIIELARKLDDVKSKLVSIAGSDEFRDLKWLVEDPFLEECIETIQKKLR